MDEKKSTSDIIQDHNVAAALIIHLLSLLIYLPSHPSVTADKNNDDRRKYLLSASFVVACCMYYNSHLYLIYIE